MQRATLWGVALVMVLGLLGVSQPASAQQTTAAITGTVDDSAGAAIAGATITARDTERGTVATTQTTQSGVFNFVNLPIGTYEVKAEAAGFDPTPHHPHAQ
jgi:Rieske Fe-S protein